MGVVVVNVVALLAALHFNFDECRMAQKNNLTCLSYKCGGHCCALDVVFFIASLRAIEYNIAIYWMVHNRNVYYIATIKYLMKHCCCTRLISAMAIHQCAHTHTLARTKINRSFEAAAEGDNLFCRVVRTSEIRLHAKCGRENIGRPNPYHRPMKATAAVMRKNSTG